jgi:integrase
MEIQRRVLKDGAVRWRVRWRQGGRYRSQTFDRKGDAVTFAAELRRRQQLGTLVTMDLGRLTLAEYVVGTWCEAYASQLAPKTWMHYRQLLNKHILPSLGPLELRAIRPETIARWQAERLAAGHGRVSVRYALTLLGAILQRPLARRMMVKFGRCVFVSNAISPGLRRCTRESRRMAPTIQSELAQWAAVCSERYRFLDRRGREHG